MPDIGTLNEGPLHASLKSIYSRPGDEIEVSVAPFVADIRRGDQIIEIQTAGFSNMRNKFDHLLDRHPIHLVHPIATKTWIIKTDEQGEQVSRRKSPKTGIAADVCSELVSFPSLLSHPNFSLEIVLIHEEQLHSPTKKRARRRRGFRLMERRLLEIEETVTLTKPADLLSLLPPGLPEVFTTADLASKIGRSKHQARGIGYCLRLAGALETDGRDKAGIRYRLPTSYGL